MKKHSNDYATFVNDDCVQAALKHLQDNSVDLIITDPPYGIDGDKLDQHYHRDEKHVVSGYIEVPASEYQEFSQKWVEQAARVLRPGGSMYVVSGYTHLRHILNALEESGLEAINHIIWKYDFGVWTTKKWVSSHYHILYYKKPGAEPTFNLESRYGRDEDSEDGGSANYQDREDVWIIGRENKPGKEKNKNELPSELLKKIIQYSSNPGDIVADFFLGGGSTARTAIGLGRKAVGFEKSEVIFTAKVPGLLEMKSGELLETLREPLLIDIPNRGKSWTEEEEDALITMLLEIQGQGNSKENAVRAACEQLGRGYWAIMKAIRRWEERNGKMPAAKKPGMEQLSLL